jgi:3'-phosphoadenosine 5'-phosphosulfate sulfotransferase (PAPS reductase)/FAD synthetase
MGNDLVVAYSGGKDSDVLLDLAIKSGVRFTAQHNHTTVDAPETVYHIRATFARLREQGVPAVINYPREKRLWDGQVRRVTMWNLIADQSMPPTRIARYCCRYFKERQFDGQHILTGVRWDESERRRNQHGLHETLSVNPVKRVVYYDENDEAHKLTDICQMRSRIATNPIIDWLEDDVWLYVKFEGLKVNPLYSLGYKRVGCIGCPLARTKVQEFEFRMYPKYRAAYLRAFQRLLERRDAEGRTRSKGWATPETLMDWFLQKKQPDDDTQLTMFGEEEENA